MNEDKNSIEFEDETEQSLKKLPSKLPRRKQPTLPLKLKRTVPRRLLIPSRLSAARS